MNNQDDDTGQSSVEAILIGGPADIPDVARNRRIIPTEEKIKIIHRGGYEHFEPIGRASSRADEADRGSGVDPVLFRWTMRTEIAE